MEHSVVIHSVMLLVGFLLITCLLQLISHRWSSVPYTASLIVSGLIVQQLAKYLGLEVTFILPPDFIYFILLPLLLFDSAYRISVHHFRLQFGTIVALATFGLLISVAVVAGMLLLFTDFTVANAFLFGAIISSTDPIAVIALFKQLGAPRRLGLVADGESMLNDATSVIVFKVVAAVVLGSTALTSDFVFGNTITFLMVFAGSLIYGGLLGAFTAHLAGRFHDNLLAMNILAIALTLFSFISAEHYLGLSGVITTVSFGVIFGNLAVPLFDHHQNAAFEHFWEFISLIAVSLVFFCSSLALDIPAISESLGFWPAVIAAVLVGRSVSVYLVCGVCNVLPILKYEPKIPLSWQHVLNWGGLRGVIPLVLAYTLPLDFAERNLLIALTMACFLFTLLVNGISIKPLLLLLGLHRPQKLEQFYNAQARLIDLELRRANLNNLTQGAFSKRLIEQELQNITETQQAQLDIMMSEQDSLTLLRSFRMGGNYVERDFAKQLFDRGYLNEKVLAAFISQLNQQLDRVEFPDLPHRSSKKEVSFDTSTTWRNRIAYILKVSPSNRFLFWLFGANTERLVQERFFLLQTRLMTSNQAVTYFESLRAVLTESPHAIEALDCIKAEQERYIYKNRRELVLLQRAFPKIIRAGQRHIFLAALEDQELAPLPKGI